MKQVNESAILEALREGRSCAATESPAPDEESAARAHFAQVLEIVAPHAKGVRFELVAIDAWILTVQDFSEDGDGELDVWHRRETVIVRG